MANEIDAGALTSHFAEQDAKANAVSGVSVAVKAGAQFTPEDWAKSSKLSLSTGVDPSALASNPLIRAAAENRVKGDALNIPDLVDTHPKVAQWMSDPVNAGITGENHGLMQGVSDAFDQLGASAFAGGVSLVGAGAKILQTGLEVAGVGLSDSEAATLYKNDPEGLKRFREESMAGGLSRFARKTQAFSTKAFDLREPTTKARYDPLKYATTTADESALLSPVKVMGDVLRSLPTSVAMGATVLFTRNVAVVARTEATAQAATLGLAGEAASAFVAKAVTAAAAKAAAVSGAASEGAAGYAMGALSAEEEAAKLDMSKSARYAQLIKEGYAPEAAKAKVVADVAEQAGMIAGLADAAVNAAAGGLLGGILTSAGGAVKSGLKTATLEGATEMVQSPLEQLGTNIGLSEIDPSRSLTEGLLESMVQGLAVGFASGGMMGTLHGLTNKGIADDTSVRNALAGHEALTKLSEAAAKAAPVRDLDKGRFKEFMQSMVEDSDVKELFLDANALHDALAQAPIETQQMFAQEMPEVISQLGEGTATDGFVRIPVADYASHIAGTDLDTTILPQLKTDLGGLTYAQAEQQMQEQQTDMQKTADELVTKYSEDAAYQADVQGVYDNILGQLEKAKRFRPDVNKKYAELQKAYFVVAAEEEGVSPSEMMKRFPLKVVGGDTLGDVSTTLEQPTAQAMKGTGRSFTAFFSAASKGERAPSAAAPYAPAIDISESVSPELQAEYAKHKGEFDAHIAASIPGFREVQQVTAQALLAAYPEGASMLDIGASEGGFAKTVSKLSNGNIKTVALDPNETMAKFAATGEQVPGAEYVMAAFGEKQQEGELAWTEDSGTKISYYKPDRLFDVVHEAMTFQFMGNERDAQLRRVVELMAPNGLAIFDEKVKEDTPAWAANEAKKDAYKAQFFSENDLIAKRKEVLEKGAEVVAAEGSAKEQAAVGMNDYMPTQEGLEQALKNNFKYVSQYWDSGNFKGYVASNSASTIDKYLGNLGSTASEFANVDTPRTVTGAQPSSSYGYRMRDAARKAALDDFAPAKVQDLLRKTDWAILTAENPAAQQLTPEENAARMAELKADLNAQGIQFQEVEGKYGGNIENSVMLVGVTQDQATAIGQKFGQEAVLTRAGLVYQDGTINPAKKVNSYEKAPADFYTRVPATGALFSVDTDVSQKLTPSGARVGEVEVEAVHFSREARTSLSGRTYGTGIRGAEAARLVEAKDSRIKNRISFYVDEGKGVFPEGGVGAFKHELTLTNMYDGAKNPLNFDASDSNTFEAAVIDAGFDGYYVRAGFGRQGAAVLLGGAADNVQIDLPPVSAYKQGDPLYNRTLLVIREQGSTSVPMLMRNLGVPKGRAEALIEQLKLDEYIVPAEGEYKFGRDTIATPIARLGQYDVTDKINVAPVFYQSAPVIGTPDIMAVKPTFYSALTKVIQEHSQKKGTPDQWIGILKNLTQKGVKPEELEVSGVLDFLENRKEDKGHWQVVQNGEVISQRPADLGKPPALEGAEVRLHEPSKSVSREEITDFLQSKAVIVSPKIYGYDPLNPGAVSELDFSFGQRETDEPDRGYLEERAVENIGEMSKLDLSNELSEPTDMNPQRSLLGDAEERTYTDRVNALHTYIKGKKFNDTQGEVDDYDEATEAAKEDYEALVEARTDLEERYYYDDSESPSYQNVSVDAAGKTYPFSVYRSYGEIEIYDTTSGEAVSLNVRRADEATIQSAIIEHLSENYDIQEGADNAPKFEDYVLPGGENYRERLLTNTTPGQAEFSYTSHFDDENIIAHTRVTERAATAEQLAGEYPELAARLKAEGRSAKVYFMEELQSDWAQQGRDKVSVKVPYKLSELTLNEEQTAASGAEMLKVVKVAQLADDSQNRPDYVPAGDALYIAQLEDAEGNILGTYPNANSVFSTREEAERARLRAAGAMWVIDAADQTFTISRANYPTKEAALAYVTDTKTHAVDKPKTKFEIAQEIALLEREHDANAKQLRVGKTDENFEGYLNLRTRQAELARKITSLSSQAIARGPFVETTDAWVALAMKDAIREAAAGGYDLVSWTTGDQQTKRWSGGLRQNVDEIEWTKSAEGVIHILARKGTRIVADTKYGENDLSAAIGKTMAKTIIENPSQTGNLQGDDIVVADLGMTKFYGDQAGMNPDGKPAIVAKVTNKVLSKIGGGKVAQLDASEVAARARRQQKADIETHDKAIEKYKNDVELYAETNEVEKLKIAEENLREALAYKARREEIRSTPSDKDFSVQPSFEITPKMKEIVMGEGQPLFQPNRGSFDPNTLTTSLLKDADLSTFLHETGHAFLEMDMARASAPDAPQRVKDRMAETLRWFGVADINVWNGMTLEQKRPYHEKFARGFEAYLLEGKAPSAELQGAFASFRSWLLHLYRSILNLNVELTPEVRQVFNKMLATDAQIAAAEEARSYGELALKGLSDTEKETYSAQDKAATEDSIDELEKRSMRDMKWLSNAKSSALKKLQVQADSKRRAIRAEVTAEVMAEPINQARTWLRKGEMIDPVSGDAVKADKGFRLDNAEIAELYPETMLSRPDVTALRGMTMNNGLPLDVVADMFGFRSGDQLVRELINGEDAKAKIDGLTDARMLEENGDLVDPRAIEEAANRAVHNEARARFIATGLKALTNSPLSSRQLAKAAANTAEEVIAAKKVRDLHPAQYTAAETKANREALKEVAKDPAKAQRAQRSALLNNRLAAASLDALEEVRKGIDHMNKVQKKAAQSSMRGEYLTQLNALLDRFDLRKGVTLKSLDVQRTPFSTWVQTEADRLSAVVPDIAGWIQVESNSTHYKNLTVEEFRGVVDTVKSLELMARREEKQYQEIRGMKFAEERSAVLDRIREFHPEAFDLDGEPLGMSPKFVKNLGDAVSDLGDKAAAEFLSAETIIDLLEGGTFGVVNEALFGRMSNRMDWKAQRMQQIQEQLKPLFEAYSLKERYNFSRKDIAADIDMSLTRENALVVALLHGNAEGRERLANYGWDLATQQNIVNLLDAKDVELAKGVWQLFDRDLWPELKQLNDRTRGKSPPKVEALEVQTKHGNVTGGYFRLKYDSNLDERVHRLDEGASVKELLGGGLGMSAKTAQGSSTERKENVTLRPRLDLGVLAEAVTETVHDLAFREAVADTMRLLNDVKVQNTIKTAAGTPAYRALVNRVREIAAPPRNPAGFIEKTLSIARKNTIVTLMSGVGTALQNFTGLATAYSGDRVAPGRLTKEIALFYSPKMAERYQFAMDNSDYMKGRHTSFERDLQRQIKGLTVNADIMPDMGTWLVLMGVVDKGTSVPVWNAAFKEGMARFSNDHKQAVDYADHTVRQTLGSGREIDISQIMGGHGGWGQLKKTFTMFQSYFNGQLGQLVRSGAINKKLAQTNPALATARFTRDFMLVYVIPMALTKMVFSPPDKEPEEWVRNYARAFAQYGMAMIPLWGSMMNSMWVAFDPTARNYGYKITPVESGVEGVIKGVKSLTEVAAGEGDDRDLKNIIMGTGFVVGLPGKLVSDTVLGTKAFLEEEAGPLAIIQGPPRK